MRSLAILASLVLLAACGTEGTLRKAPAGRFYFPTAVVHVPGATGAGQLVVASSNFDNRYDYGMLTSVSLDALGLPAFGTVPETVPELTDLKLPAGEGCDGELGCDVQGANERLIETFAAAEVGVLPVDGAVRFFVPSRGAANRLHAIDLAPGGALTCVRPATGDNPSDCREAALSLTANEDNDLAKPNAPELGGAVADPASGEVFAFHRYPAYDPIGSTVNGQSYLVSLDGREASPEPTFSPIGIRGAASITLAGRYALLGGYYHPSPPRIAAPLLRAVDRSDPTRVFDLGLESSFRSVDTRGAALSSDGKRLFLLGRSPDTLIVVALEETTGERPRARAIRGMPLPDDPSQLVVIPRAGQGDLVAITCAQAGVVLYDEDLGALTAQALDVGGQPFGISAAVQPGGGARLFVSHFSDGQVGVYDIPDLVNARTLRLVARVGETQRCLTDEQGC